MDLHLALLDVAWHFAVRVILIIDVDGTFLQKFNHARAVPTIFALDDVMKIRVESGKIKEKNNKFHVSRISNPSLFMRTFPV